MILLGHCDRPGLRSQELSEDRTLRPRLHRKQRPTQEQPLRRELTTRNDPIMG